MTAQELCTLPKKQGLPFCFKVSEMCTLEDVVNQLKEEYPGLVHMKIPTCNSAAPSEADFDIIRFNIDFNFNEILHNGKSDRKAYKL